MFKLYRTVTSRGGDEGIRMEMLGAMCMLLFAIVFKLHGVQWGWRKVRKYGL